MIALLYLAGGFMTIALDEYDKLATDFYRAIGMMSAAQERGPSWH